MLFFGVSKIKVLLAIDSLVAGGAQRQLILLYRHLRMKNYDTKFLIHNDKVFYNIERENLLVIDRKSQSKISTIFSYIKQLSDQRPDVVIAYGGNAAVMAELSSIFVKSYKLIISERNLRPNHSFISLFARRIMHYFLADEFFVNSESQRRNLAVTAPFLDCHVVLNTLDHSFFPSGRSKAIESEMNILGLGKYLPQKNIIFFIELVKCLVARKPNIRVNVRWYGDEDGKDKRHYKERCQTLISANSLDSVVSLYSEVSDVEALYQWASVLVLPSISEGTPNVALEAMAHGIPICLSDVSDNERLIEDDKNGYLLSLDDAAQWADAISSIMTWDSQRVDTCRRTSEKILNSHYGYSNLDKIEGLIRGIS